MYYKPLCFVIFIYLSIGLSVSAEPNDNIVNYLRNNFTLTGGVTEFGNDKPIVRFFEVQNKKSTAIICTKNTASGGDKIALIIVDSNKSHIKVSLDVQVPDQIKPLMTPYWDNKYWGENKPCSYPTTCHTLKNDGGIEINPNMKLKDFLSEVSRLINAPEFNGKTITGYHMFGIDDEWYLMAKAKTGEAWVTCGTSKTWCSISWHELDGFVKNGNDAKFPEKIDLTQPFSYIAIGKRCQVTVANDDKRITIHELNSGLAHPILFEKFQSHYNKEENKFLLRTPPLQPKNLARGLSEPTLWQPHFRQDPWIFFLLNQ